MVIREQMFQKSKEMRTWRKGNRKKRRKRGGGGRRKDIGNKNKILEMGRTMLLLCLSPKKI